MPTSYASERRDRKRAKQAERLALIAGLLGGIGQGISAFTGARDRRTAEAQRAKQLELLQDKQDELERANRAKENISSITAWQKMLAERARAGEFQQKERRLTADSEAKRKYYLSKAAGDAGAKLSATQENALGLAAMESGLDQDSPDLVKYIKGEIAKAQEPNKTIDIFGAKDVGAALNAYTENQNAARQKAARLKVMQTALGGLGQRRRGVQQPAIGAAPGGGEPDNDEPEMPGDVDEKNEGDLLGAMGAFWGAAQQGVDMSHPALAPMWGILESLGFAVPQRVKAARQASMMPQLPMTLGGMPAQGPPAPAGFQPR